MNIETANTTIIAAQMSDIIGHGVNIMNREGIIIASTDPSRIGFFHGGSHRVITEQLPELVITYDNEYQGTKKGINLPIVLEGNIIGVIGIRGDYQEVIHYGKIIQQMTQILILEKHLEAKARLDKGLLREFMKELLTTDTPLPSRELQERGRLLDIDVTLKRRVMVLGIVDVALHRETKAGYQRVKQVEQAISELLGQTQGGLSLTLGDTIVFMPRDCSNDVLQGIGQSVIDTIAQQYQLAMTVGMDQQGESFKTAHQQADKAFQVATTTKPLVFYENLMLEMFLGDIPQPIKQAFVNKLYAGLSDKDRADTIQLLRIYYETNCSISETAKRLFIHKNTVQYKLKRLLEITGHDPRHIQDAVIFHMSLLFHGN